MEELTPFLYTLQVKSPFLVKQTKFWYKIGSPNPPIGNQVKHLLIILSIFLFPFLSYSQTQRAESIVIPVSALGDVTETRKQILQNTLEEKLKRFFKLISQERFEEAQEESGSQLHLIS